jgi:hypothetical protein
MGKSSSNPPVPGMSPEELAAYANQKDAYGKAGNILDSEYANTKEGRALLQSLSGLYGPDGKVNQAAVDALRAQIDTQQQQAGKINQTQGDRLLRALNGESPVGATQLNDERKQFALLQEQAARRGIRLKGDDLFSATSDSTAGNQMLASLRNNAQMARERQTQAEIQTGYGNYTGSLGLGYGQTLTNLNAAQSVSAAPLAQGYMGLGQGYGESAQPYQDQRYLQYQRDVQNKQNKTNRRLGYIGLGANIAGQGASLFTLGALNRMPGQTQQPQQPPSYGQTPTAGVAYGGY